MNTEIPFTYTFDKADPCLVGKEVKLSTSLVAESIDQIKLYYVDGEQKTELKLETIDKNYHYTKEPLAVGNLAEGASYRFLLSSGRPITEDEYANVSVSVGTVGGKSVPTDNKNASLIISETPITTHKVQVNLQDLTVQDEVTTVIDQKSLVLVLLPSMGYQLPSSVTITMDGNTPVSYTHLTLPTICSV